MSTMSRCAAMSNRAVFHLFAGDFFYPSPGLGDYVGQYESLERAKSMIERDGDGNLVCGPRAASSSYAGVDWATVAHAAPGGLVPAASLRADGEWVDHLDDAGVGHDE